MTDEGIEGANIKEEIKLKNRRDRGIGTYKENYFKSGRIRR